MTYHNRTGKPDNISIKDFVDELKTRVEAYRQKYILYVRVPSTFIRWILFTVPVYFIGKIIDRWYELITSGQFEWTYTSISNELLTLLQLFGFIILWFIGTIWRVRRTEIGKHVNSLHYALRWFYTDLGFGENPNADIRCTLWTPKNSKVSAENMKLIQIVDYIPAYGQISEQSNDYRRNSNRGRIRKVAVLNGNVVKPVGLIGKCLIETMKAMKPIIMYEDIPENVDFNDYMVRVWNFSKAEAKRLTNDRRAYMSLSLMNSGQTDVLGIIFLDARVPNTV